MLHVRTVLTITLVTAGLDTQVPSVRSISMNAIVTPASLMGNVWSCPQRNNMDTSLDCLLLSATMKPQVMSVSVSLDSQESTVKKTSMNVLQTLAKMVVLVRTCLGIILAIAHLITFPELFMEEGTVLIFSWAVPISNA